MITPSFALTATERVLPRLALDFTTASLDPRVTFTRTGNTATVTNSSGLIAPINANLPRFDFDPITLACKGLLIEEARTNLLLYSEQFDNAYWNKNNATITANATTAPDGALTGDKLVENTANNYHYIRRAITTSANTSHTYSIYAKASERQIIRIAFYDGATVFIDATFNLSNGSIFSTVAGTASIVNVGNGWYRCICSGTSSASAGGGLVDIYLCDAAGNNSYLGDGSSGLFIWGIQLEVGAFPTSYIPTVASTVLRNADDAVMVGTNFSNWYNATEGTFVASAQIPSTGGTTRRILSVNDTTIGENIQIARTTTQGYFEMRDGGAVVVSTTNGSIAEGVEFIGSFAYKLNDCAVSCNAAVPTTDTTATLPTVTQAQLGVNLTTYMNGWLKKINYYPQRLTNNEVRAFSK